MKLKVCGMKYNPWEVAEIQPDYLGFIFWEPSARFFTGQIPQLPETIQKVGVFVDAGVSEIVQKVEKYSLDIIQLHGSESPEFCQNLRETFLAGASKNTNGYTPNNLKIMKVFSIKDQFDFSILQSYEEVCDYFLFDTKGELPGGNGYAFDWSVLENYPSTKPYFLSGGIGLESSEKLTAFLRSPASAYCHAIDINSKFELQPGLKNVQHLKEFKEILNNLDPLNTTHKS